MTQNENQVFENMQKNIENLKHLRNELKIVTLSDFELTRDKNIENIEKYEQFHLKCLNEISLKIHKTFESLHETLNERTEILQETVDGYDKLLNKQVSSHNDKIREIDRKLRDCLNLIDQDKFQFNDTIKRCKDIIKKNNNISDNNNNNDDDEDDE